MGLQSVVIGQYKKLKDFSLSFEGDSFIEIFRHLYEYDKDKAGLIL